MAYRFKLNEPFEDGVRRIGLQQIDRAIVQLKSSGNAGVAIHESRKTFKRIRALLRLVRPGLVDEVYENENARYRDIGRSLSQARDRQVLMETVDRFEQEAVGRTKTAFTAARSRLTVGPPNEAHTQVPAVAMDEVIAGRAAMAELEISGAGYDTAWDGLERAYRQAGRGFETAYKTLDDEAIHDWRKRVQTHWRHMSLLSEAWPELMAARIATAKQLSTLLGEDHDISVMLETLRAQSSTDLQHPDPKSAGGKPVRGKPALSPHQHKLAQEFAIDRQSQLRAISRNLGHRLFAESAAAFRARMSLYWVSAQADGQLQS